MSTPSNRVVDELQARDSRVRRRGFPKALRALSDSTWFAEAVRGVIPDAFLLDHDNFLVIIYEVVDTNPIRPEKAVRLAELSDELDELGWDLLVVTLDYTGHVTSELPGWAYLPAYTHSVAPGAVVDVTPAARAVMREVDSPSEKWTDEQVYEAVMRMAL